MLSSCRWFAAIIALALTVRVTAQQQPPPPPPAAGAQRFADATTELIAAINADDQPAIQQMFSEEMQKALPADKTGPFFRGLLSAKGKLQAAGAPEVSGPAATVRVTAERGDWQFEIALDPSGKIAGLRVLPGDDNPGRKEAPPASDRPAGEEAEYYDLRRSKDRLTQQTAERYFNLVRVQEWSDATGKFKTTAKYVAHDPKLQWVKLQVTKGRGEAPVVKDIPVAKLSKTCQSRVRQIALLQGKLDELAAAAPANGEAGGSPGEERGGPMLDERGNEPRPRRRPKEVDAPAAEPNAGEFSSRAPAKTEDPSAAEEDPLGFAEIPAGPPVAVGGPSGVTLFAAQPNAGEAPGAVDRKQWSTNYAAFRANFTITKDERGETRIDWGELKALRALGKTAANPPEEDPEVSREDIADLGLLDVQWEAPFQAIRQKGPDTLNIAFDLPALPPPLQIEFQPDTEGSRSSPDEWAKFEPGDRIQFSGRFHMTGPTSIVVYVDEPQPVASASPAANGDSRR